jgi:hypothetical protein
MTTRDLDSKSRLFHAMVLMGGSLALGCGGLSDEDREGSASGGSGANGPAAGSGGTGGGISFGGGGSSAGSSSGGATAGNAGMGTGGSAPSACPPAQFDCSASGPSCSGVSYSLPSDCACDETRPRTAADCDSGEAFVCFNAETGPDGQPIESVGFACQCLPEQDECELLCDQIGMAGATCSDVMGDAGRTVLCNCAVIVLR